MTKDNRSTFYMLQLNSGIVISPNALEKLSSKKHTQQKLNYKNEFMNIRLHLSRPFY